MYWKINKIMIYLGLCFLQFFVISCSSNLNKIRIEAYNLIQKKNYKKAKELLDYSVKYNSKPKIPPYIEDTTLFYYRYIYSPYIQKRIHYDPNSYSWTPGGEKFSFVYKYGFSEYTDKFNEIMTFNSCISEALDSNTKAPIWITELKKKYSWKNTCSLSPEYPYLYYLLAEISFEEDSLDKAKNYLHNALFYYPDFAEAVAKVMIIFIINDKLDSANIIAKKTLSRQLCKMDTTGTSIIYARLGYISLKEGNNNLANEYFEKSIKYDYGTQIQYEIEFLDSISIKKKGK
jgi:tetratricopeptide (TPR) repeat protein